MTLNKMPIKTIVWFWFRHITDGGHSPKDFWRVITRNRENHYLVSYESPWGQTMRRYARYKISCLFDKNHLSYSDWVTNHYWDELNIN